MKLKTHEIAVFGMLGALMFLSTKLLELLPNVHLLDAFLVAETVVYRKKALYPLYLYVLLSGIAAGFATWWIPYLYVWTVLWGVVLLLPRSMGRKTRCIVYMTVSALHGFLFGVLYAPAQALLFGLNFRGMLAWIAAGLPFDLIHGVSNFCCGILICPLIAALRAAEAHPQGR